MKKNNLHKTYYLLALVDVVTIIITLFLAYSMHLTYEELFRVNEQWMQRGEKYDQLAELAVGANGPGNNVFYSKNIEKESKNLENINNKINNLKVFIYNDARTELEQYPEIIEKIESFSYYISKANNLTNKIFNLLLDNKIEMASEIMSKMDKEFHNALLEISNLRQIIRKIQKDRLFFFHEKAKKIFFKEVYIAVFILFLVALILFFGKKIKESFDTMVLELENKNNNLSDSEEKLTSVLNTMLESVILIDSNGIVQYINPEAEKVFQYKKEEIVGKNINILMPEPHRTNHDKYINNYIKTKTAKIIGHTRELKGIRKDGSILDVELGVNEVKLKNELLFAGVLKDITEKKKNEMYLSNISKIQELYINGATQNEVFDTILKFLLDYTGSEYGFIGAIFYDENDAPYLKTFAITNISWDETTRKFYEEHSPDGLEFKNLNTLFGHTIKTGEIVISNDPSVDPRAGGLPKGHPPMYSYLGMPIYSSNKLIAMYGMANRKGGYNKVVTDSLGPITSVITSIIESTISLSIIEKMANIDSLTGAYNRFYLKKYISDIIDKDKKGSNNKNFVFFIIDFNKFKDINDFYGHEYGDYVIKEFVNRAQSNIKKKDIIARIGGDEFVIVLDSVLDISNVETIAKRFVEKSKEPYFFKNKKLDCSVSIGISCYPNHGDNIDELMRKADLALYKAKNNINRYCYFSHDLEKKYLKQQNLEKDIFEAFNKHEFDLLFQPKVRMDINKIIGCEALIRWKHSKYGCVSALDFIPVIESMGLAGRLNLYIVEKVLLLFNNIHVEEKFLISINISPYVNDINENIKSILDIIKKYSIDKKIKINLEITESNFISRCIDFKKGSKIDKLLTAQNIGLSIDDFGVKYSSVSRLLDYNFSIIKIDMSFIHKLDTKESTSVKIILKAVIDIVSGLGIDIVAEGVESKNQVDELIGLGCKTAQGFYYYKPLNIEQLKKIINI